MTYQPHMTMKAILDKEESRKSGQRNKPSKRKRPKAKNNIDLLKSLEA